MLTKCLSLYNLELSQSDPDSRPYKSKGKTRIFPRTWTLLEQRSPQRSSLRKSSILRNSLNALVWNRGGLLNLLLPINYRCLATLELKFQMAFSTAFWSLIVIALVSSSRPFHLLSPRTYKSRIPKGDIACSEHASFQELGGCASCALTAKMGLWRFLRARMGPSPVSPPFSLFFIILYLSLTLIH
jgi:hypothetical protein